MSGGNNKHNNGSNIVTTHTLIPQIPSRGHAVLFRNPFTTAHDNLCNDSLQLREHMRNFTRYSHAAIFFFFFLYSASTASFQEWQFYHYFFFKLLLALMFAKITAQVTLPFFFQGGPFVVRPRCPLKRTLTNIRHCYKNSPIRPYSVQCFAPPPPIRSYNACSALPLSTFSALESVGKLIFHR